MGVSKSISEETAIWFHKPSLLHQSIFSIPVLGYLSTLQAIMIFGIGLPLMFAILYVANDSEYAVIPPIVMAVIAMVRPPVMSYEARALAALRFLMGGGVKPKKKAKSRSLAVPSGGKAKTEEAVEEPPDVPQDISVAVTDKPVEVSLRLRTVDGSVFANKKVRVLLDGQEIKTTLSSTTGEILLLLESSDCFGQKTVSIHALRDDDTIEPKSIMEKRFTFVRDTGLGR